MSPRAQLVTLNLLILLLLLLLLMLLLLLRAMIVHVTVESPVCTRSPPVGRIEEQKVTD